MVGRWVSFWDCLFLEAMLNFRGVSLRNGSCFWRTSTKNAKKLSSSKTKNHKRFFAKVPVTYWNQRASNSLLEHINPWSMEIYQQDHLFQQKKHTHTHTMLNIYDVKNPWPFVPVMGLSPTSSAVILLVSRKKTGHEGLVNCFKAQEFVPKKIPKDCKGKRQQPRIGKRVSAPKAQLKKHGWETNRIRLKSLQRHHLKQDHC